VPTQKIVLEFVGDVNKLKPVTDALKGIKGLTKENAAEFNKVNEAAKKTGTSLDSTKKKAKGVTDETKKTKKGVDDLGRSAKKLPTEFNKAKNSMRGVKGATDGMVGSVKRLGGALAAAFGITSGIFLFAKFVKSLINVNKEFELQMARVKAITGATDKEFKQLSKNAKKLGASTKFTATEVAKLSEEYAKLGFSTKEIIDASEATLLLAEATGTELAEAANVTGQVLRAFGLEADETARVTDVMALSFSKSALNMQSFAEAMKFVAPIAKSANIDIEMTTALLGKLADAGLRGSIAGTGLKNLLSKLADANSDLSKELGFSVKNSTDLIRAFKKLKDGNIDLTKATELTDERSKAAFLTLISGVDSAEALYEALKKATGATEEMAKVMRDTLQGDIDKLGASWEALMIQLSKGEGLRTSIQLLTKWLNLTQRVFSSHKDLLEKDIDDNREMGKRMAEDFGKSIKALQFSIEQLNPVPELGLQAAIFKTNEEVELLQKGLDEFQKTIDEGKGFVQLDTGLPTKEVQHAMNMMAQYEARLDGASDLLYKLKDAAKALELGGGGSGQEVVNAVNSIKNLNDEIKKLKTTYVEAEIGSSEWIKALGDITLKTYDLAEANRIAKEEVLKFKAANDLIEPTGHIETFNRLEHELKEWEKKQRAIQEKAINDKLRDEKIMANNTIENQDERSMVIQMAELEHLQAMREYHKNWGDEVGDIDVQISENQRAIWDDTEERYQRFLAGMAADAKEYSGIITAEQNKQFQDMLSIADGVYSGMTSLQSTQIQIQQRNLQNQIDAGLISEETADKKRRELMRRQASIDKQAALFKAIINTAAAVATALTAGPVAGQILAGITAALGAVEIGIIASSPVPAFAKGTKEAPKGFKWVGEKGAELIYDDGGYPIITHKESNLLADKPYSPEAKAIMKKYDIPQLHTGLFGNGLDMNHHLLSRTNGARGEKFDYNKLAKAMARELSGNGDIVGAINAHKKSDKRGIEFLAYQFSKMKQPKRGGYA